MRRENQCITENSDCHLNFSKMGVVCKKCGAMHSMAERLVNLSSQIRNLVICCGDGKYTSLPGRRSVPEPLCSLFTCNSTRDKILFWSARVRLMKRIILKNGSQLIKPTWHMIHYSALFYFQIVKMVGSL